MRVVERLGFLRIMAVLGIFGVILAVTGCGGAPRVPAAAPVRNALVYAKLPRGTYSGDLQLWVAGPTGKHARSLGVRSGGSGEPQISPDGRYIAYQDINTGQVRVIPTAGGKPIVLGFGDGPIWAPNSRFIAFKAGSGGGIAVAEVRAGKPVTTITAVRGNIRHGPGFFSFSPSSQRIAYDESGALYVVRTIGGRSVRLTRGRHDSDPVWGKLGIAFVRFHGAEGDIWLTDGAGSAAHQLTHGGNYNGLWPKFFSANGRKLLASNPDMNEREHPAQLWAVALPSGRIRLLRVHQHRISALGLSRDGKTVLADSGCYADLEIIPFAGGKPDVIYRGLAACDASWNH